MAEFRGLQPRYSRGAVRVEVHRHHLALVLLHRPQLRATSRKVGVEERADIVRRLEQRQAPNHILVNLVVDLLRQIRDATITFVSVVCRDTCEPVCARDMRREVVIYLIAEIALRVVAAILLLYPLLQRLGFSLLSDFGASQCGPVAVQVRGAAEGLARELEYEHKSHAGFGKLAAEQRAVRDPYHDVVKYGELLVARARNMTIQQQQVGQENVFYH